MNSYEIWERTAYYAYDFVFDIAMDGDIVRDHFVVEASHPLPQSIINQHWESLQDGEEYFQKVSLKLNYPQCYIGEIPF